ncbi:MAG: Com family DNA-binding transcriptional regulator [Thermodesulfobacteriota bacterium]|nr:Com family DNA-binding transcriptional regulator [Thermodesulfobacteriota bacterium]
MGEIRCKKCGRLLMKGEIIEVEIKCPKCGYVQTLRLKDKPKNEVSENQRERCSLDLKEVFS